MEKSTEVRALVASLLRVREDEITGDTSLRQFGSSLEAMKLASGLKRLGLQLPGATVGPRFDDLLRQLSVNGASPTATTAATTFSLPVTNGDGISVGIDIEEVAALPVAADAWEDGFYRDHFAPPEIARCLLQADARVHFAGVWCVKEALRKSRPEFLSVPMNHILVSHDASGAPSLSLIANDAKRALPCSVSISHTSTTAAAVVVWANTPAPIAPAASPAAPAPVAAARPDGASAAPSGAGRVWIGLSLGLSIIALGVSLYLLTPR